MNMKILFISLVLPFQMVLVPVASAVSFQSQLPSRPVLAVDAGILPGSPFYFLDNFDEWIQINIFSFGLKNFQAQMALQNASERIAELQVLDARGLRNANITRVQLERWLAKMELAASVAGNSFENGGRPVTLTNKTVRTMIGSIESVETLFRESEQIELVSADDGEQYQETERSDTPYRFMDIGEDRIVMQLMPQTAALPDDIVRSILLEQLARAERALEQAREILNNDEEKVHIGGKELFELAESSMTQATVLFDNGRYLMAMDFAREVRDATRLISSEVLSVDKNFSGGPAVEVDRLATATNVLRKSGLLEESYIRELSSRAQKELVEVREH